MHHRLCHATNDLSLSGKKHMNYRSLGRHAIAFAIACCETCTTLLLSAASPEHRRASWCRSRLVRRAGSQSYRSLDNRLCPYASSRTGTRVSSLSLSSSCLSLGRREVHTTEVARFLVSALYLHRAPLCFGASARDLTSRRRTTLGSRCRFRGLRRVSCISSRHRPCRLGGRAMCRPCL